MPILSKDLFRKPKNALESLGQRFNLTPAAAPDDLYATCPACKRASLKEELAQNLQVCPRCGHHLRLAPRRRLALLADPGSFQELDADFAAVDPLQFPDYGQKLDKARAASGEKEGVLTSTLALDGQTCAVFCMDPAFMMGSMGTVVGDKITRLFEYALARSLPVIGFTVSGGARMQEGILSLMQMAKTSAAVRRHSDAGNLYIAVLTDPTTGGVTASFAMEADITLAEPGALIGFAGPRVIEQTIRQKLPEGFQRAEFLQEHGFVDRIAPRDEQRALLSRLLRLHGREART